VSAHSITDHLRKAESRILGMSAKQRQTLIRMAWIQC
jgi:hypothetical protein